jgi:hypothetical protein
MMGLARSFSMTGLIRQHDARAGAGDHQPLQAEVPDAGALRQHPRHRDIDHGRRGPQHGDDEVDHRRVLQGRFVGQAREVMNSAIAAFTMSMAAEGSPAMTGR